MEDKPPPIVTEFTDSDEYSCFKKRGDPVLHIEIRNAASLLVIAPLSANTLAKISNGICDNLLTNVYRCWPYKQDKTSGSWSIYKPIIVAPAMNTQMYEHPITEKQLKELN